MSTEKIVVIDPKLNPALEYPLSEIPDDIRKIINDGKLMPYVHCDAKGKWVAGYSFAQTMMLCAVNTTQQLRQVKTLIVVGTKPERPGSAVLRTLLDIYSVHAYQKKHRKYANQEGMRTYVVRCDAHDWENEEGFHQFLMKNPSIIWKDVTERNKAYQERSKAKQEMQSKKKNPVQR